MVRLSASFCQAISSLITDGPHMGFHPEDVNLVLTAKIV
jgi:hypothetical protein